MDTHSNKKSLIKNKLTLITINTDKSMYSQNCIKRSPFGQRKCGLYKTDGLVKEVEFI